MNNIVTKKMYFSIVFSCLAIVLTIHGCSSGKSTTENQSPAGAEWILETMNGKSVTSFDDKSVTLNFDETPGRISGRGSCNTFFGSYKLDGSALKFSEIGSTKMMCDNMQVETEYFSLLKSTDKYEIKSGKLSLYGSSSVILVFKKK